MRQRPTRGHQSALPVSLGHRPRRVLTQKTLEEKQRCTGPFGNSLARCQPHGPEHKDTRSALHVGSSVRTDASRLQRLSLAESTCKIRINDSRRAVQTLHNLSKLRFAPPRRWPYLLSTEPLFFQAHLFIGRLFSLRHCTNWRAPVLDGSSLQCGRRSTPIVNLKLGKVNVVDNSNGVGVLAFNIEGEGAAAQA